MVVPARLLLPGSQDVALFKEGFPANDAIKLMAEDGDNSALLVRAGGLRWFYSCSSYAVFWRFHVVGISSSTTVVFD